MHIPPYISKFDELKKKGVDKVAIIAFNDAYVMSAWGKVNMVTGDDIVSVFAIPCMLTLRRFIRLIFRTNSSSLRIQRASSRKKLAGISRIEGETSALLLSWIMARLCMLRLRSKSTTSVQEYVDQS